MRQHEGRAGWRAPVGRREISRLIRQAALGAYGVVAVRGPRWSDRLLGRLGVRVPGVRVDADGHFRVEIHLALAAGLPARAVASNVEESVRYVVQRELGRAIDELRILVDGQPMSAHAGGAPPRA